MKVSIFGASGATGLLLTERCLAAGYDVSALVQTLATFPFRDQLSRQHAPRHQNTVIVASRGLIGFQKRMIVAAMQQAGVRRIITLGGASGRRGVGPQAAQNRGVAHSQLVLRRHPEVAFGVAAGATCDLVRERP